MDPKRIKEQQQRGAPAPRRRSAPGSKPTPRVFLPYVVLAVVLALAGLWIYVIGPEGEDRGELLHQETDAGPQVQRPGVG